MRNLAGACLWIAIGLIVMLFALGTPTATRVACCIFPVAGGLFAIRFPAKSTTEYKVSLDQRDFAKLVRGGVVEHPPVKIILSDIGYDAMAEEVADARWREGSAP